MRQTLTQPEEIDCLWRSMAGFDWKEEAPEWENASYRAEAVEDISSAAAKFKAARADYFALQNAQTSYPRNTDCLVAEPLKQGERT